MVGLRVREAAQPNMKRKILFLVDHKHRDLPSLVLIGSHLERFGFEPLYIGAGNELEVIAREDPEFIVMPKPVYDAERLLRWRFEGRRLIVIETEGNAQDMRFVMRILVTPDLYLFWNADMAERHRDQLKGRGVERRVLGFPRSDFLHSRFDRVFPSRHELLARYGLDPAHKTVTIATSSQDAHFSDERIRQKTKRRARALATKQDYSEIVANMRELRDTTVDVVERLRRRFPDVNVALKPHPHENAVFWADFVESLNDRQVALIVGEPINHLLRVSDFHVAYNVCTTTVEALMAGLPAAELHTRRSGILYSDRHLALPTYVIRSYEDLEIALTAELSDAPAATNLTPANVEKLQAYIADFFTIFDGRRCEAYADALAEWAAGLPPPARGAALAVKRPRQAALYALLRARRAVKALLSPAYRRTRRNDVEVNAPTTTGDRPVREIKSVVVDAEFGLYDNRMRPGDERLWIDRFRDAGIVEPGASVP